MPKPFEIHPAFGVARIGTSDEFFIGPEPGVVPPAKYRDAAGRLKRQAARFRVYTCERDAAGVLTSAAEVKPADGKITWTVHVANRKSANKRFLGSGHRNGAVPNNDAANAALIVDPGSRTFAGPNQPAKVFDGGKFKGTPVPLGAALTDADGRLVVMGAAGTSDSVPPQGTAGAPALGNFADNDGWFDDVADGPVTATVQLTGQAPVEAVSAWVLVGPPDYAPPVTNLITLYDIGMQVAVDKTWLAAPTVPSFARDIQPILARAVGYQWVNRRAKQGHSGGMGGNFGSDWAALADPATGPGVASVVLDRLRDPRTTPIPDPPVGSSLRWMPRLHDETNSDKVLPLTRVQYGHLKAWEAGGYVDDLVAGPPSELEPEALTRVALQGCSGGAFFPGIEAGFVMKDANIYLGPFRLDGTKLKPGQITAGNALPWQADFLACTWESHGGGGNGIGWWPAQRPDHVFLEAAPTGAQVDWAAGVTAGFEDMVAKWHKLGVLVERVVAGQTRVVEVERTLPR